MSDKEEGAFEGEERETNPEFNLSHRNNQLERGLQSRHIQFLALGIPSPTFSLTSTDSKQAVPSEQVYSSAQAVSCQIVVQHHYS